MKAYSPNSTVQVLALVLTLGLIRDGFAQGAGTTERDFFSHTVGQLLLELPSQGGVNTPQPVLPPPIPAFRTTKHISLIVQSGGTTARVDAVITALCEALPPDNAAPIADADTTLPSRTFSTASTSTAAPWSESRSSAAANSGPTPSGRIGRTG